MRCNDCTTTNFVHILHGTARYGQVNGVWNRQIKVCTKQSGFECFSRCLIDLVRRSGGHSFVPQVSGYTMYDTSPLLS